MNGVMQVTPTASRYGGCHPIFVIDANIASKQSKKRKAAVDWYGRPYDPDDIDEQQIVINLKSIANARRPGR